MTDLKVTTTNPTKKSHTALMAGAGAAVGAGARYVLPTKQEFSSIFNKENIDTFVSSTAVTARANNRSIVKYGAIGAAVAAGISFLAKVFNVNSDQNTNSQYTKYQAILDAPECACLAMWYEA